MRAINHKLVKVGVVIFTAVALFYFSISPNTQAQNVTIFTSDNNFPIPENNSQIRFSTNGSYTSATLQNGTWLFKDLTLYNSTRSNNLKVSAHDSNLTIYSYSTSSSYSQFSRFARITFFIEGLGTQKFNLCLNNSQPTHYSEWAVVLPDGTFLAEGKNWQLLSDDSIVLSELTGYATLVHYGFSSTDNSNLSFFEQHSVALVTLALVSLTIIFSTIISYKTKRKKYGY